eukprot:Nk52_evm29s240 gene=Nk52_evmTU29s240
MSNPSLAATPGDHTQVYGCDFEVFGRVQGVFFRKYTMKQATKTRITGWCRNTDRGTVEGRIEGVRAAVDEMKIWLEKTGSPKSKIENCVFGKLMALGKREFSDFAIRR